MIKRFVSYFIAIFAGFWTILEAVGFFFEDSWAKAIKTWNDGVGFWILLILSGLLAFLSLPLGRAFISRLFSWFWKERRYILLAVLLICLEGTLYWLAGSKLVAFSLAHLALVVLAILLLFAPKRPTIVSSLDATDDLIQKIGFDYLPEESPLDNRWELCGESRREYLQPYEDPDYGYILRIEAEQDFCMERPFHNSE